jgi:hypothetical protein
MLERRAGGYSSTGLVASGLRAALSDQAPVRIGLAEADRCDDFVISCSTLRPAHATDELRAASD